MVNPRRALEGGDVAAATQAAIDALHGGDCLRAVVTYDQ